MAIVITHAKTNQIPDWTQTDLDAAIVAGRYPPGTVLADIVLASDWDTAHAVTGLATVAETGAYGDLTGTPTIPTVLADDLTLTVGTGGGEDFATIQEAFDYLDTLDGNFHSVDIFLTSGESFAGDAAMGTTWKGDLTVWGDEADASLVTIVASSSLGLSASAAFGAPFANFITFDLSTPDGGELTGCFGLCAADCNFIGDASGTARPIFAGSQQVGLFGNIGLSGNFSTLINLQNASTEGVIQGSLAFDGSVNMTLGMFQQAPFSSATWFGTVTGTMTGPAIYSDGLSLTIVDDIFGSDPLPGDTPNILGTGATVSYLSGAGFEKLGIVDADSPPDASLLPDGVFAFSPNGDSGGSCLTGTVGGAWLRVPFGAAIASS